MAPPARAGRLAGAEPVGLTLVPRSSGREATAASRADLVLAGLFTALGYGALYAGPIYRAAAAADLGWSRGAAALAFAVGQLASLVVPLLAGLTADRWGARLVLAAGGAGTALALLGAAATSALWQWHATAGVGLAAGVGTTWAAASVLASRSERRGASLGLVLGASGAGLTVGPPLAQLLVDALGWRAALALAAAGFALIAVAGGVRALRGQPADPALRPGTPIPRAPGSTPSGAGSGPVRRARLAGFFAGNALIGLFDESVYQHAYAYGAALGLSGTAAAGLISVVSVAYAGGTAGGGALSDLVGRRPVLVAAALGSAASLLGLAGSSPGRLHLWGAAFGLALGATIAVRSAAWADAFAGPTLGRSVGIVASGYFCGAAVMTYGGAAWLDAGGSFEALYAAAAAAAVLWALLGGALARPADRAVVPVVSRAAAAASRAEPGA